VQYILNLTVAQQLLCKFLCDKLSHGECLHDGALTEPSLFDLLCCKGKHRKQFDHYLYDDVRHYRGGGDVGINLETPEEIPQTFKEF
jgi:hypothetical protein